MFDDVESKESPIEDDKKGTKEENEASEQGNKVYR